MFPLIDFFFLSSLASSRPFSPHPDSPFFLPVDGKNKRYKLASDEASARARALRQHRATIFELAIK